MENIRNIIPMALKPFGGAVNSLVIDPAQQYVNYIRNCGQNLDTLRGKLERLHLERHVIDGEVMRGREKLKVITEHTALWLESVQKFIRDEDLEELMIKDIEIAKVALILMQDDLKSLIESNGEIRDLVVEVMEDITQRKELVGTDEKLSEAGINIAETDKEIAKVLDKLLKETFEDFKELMKKDKKMAVAARQLLEDLEDFDKLLEEDKEMAVIVKGSRGMSYEQGLLQINENTFRNAVRSLLKPVGELMVNEDLMKSLPENVRLGVGVMCVVAGDSEGLMAEVDAKSDNLRRSSFRCGCASFIEHFRDRHDMSVAAENIINKIKLIIEDIPARPLTRSKARVELEAIPTYAVGLESRKDLLENIVVALTHASVDVVAAYGMGGSGKTTLGKEVVNSKANGAFDKVVMVEISETPSIERIQDQIAGGLGLSLDKAHGIPEKAIRLYNRLKSEGNKNGNECKKTLIILDNIWREFNLNEVGIPREYCKILVTSRERDVCKLMGVEEANIFNVDLLNEREAMDLFQNQVGKHIDTGEFKSVADRLLEKCGGLPLSIVTTANSLKGKDLPLWLKFVDELEKPISCQVSGVLHETFKILRTSYEVMESEEKKIFFLLACLSPIGASISIVNLMRYGIGLDLFQHANKLSEAMDQAHRWAEELVSSSMLLEGDSKENVKIHDVVRESTMLFASKGGLENGGHMFLVDAIPRWISKETFNEYTGISLLSGTDYSRLNGVKGELLQILLLKGNVNYKSPDSNFFQGMANLKVLVMSAMNFEEGLPESMGKLKDLKTLHLESCKLGDIKLIGKLESLLVLSFHRSTLEGIPDDIGMLRNLRLLDMGKCECKLPFPANVIDRLSHLEGLYLLRSSFQEWVSIDGLNKLDHLNMLEISVQDIDQLPYQAQFVKNLDKFKIYVGPVDEWEIQPSERVFGVTGEGSSRDSNDDCFKEVLRKADLLHLGMLSMNVVPELDEEGFRDLSYLYLCHLGNLQRICEGTAPAGVFSNLRHLKLWFLNEVKELLHVNLLPRNLITLNIRDCSSLSFLFSENINTSLKSIKGARVNQEAHVIELPCLESLKLYNVRSLISVTELSSIDDSGDQCFFNSKVKFPSLKLLHLISNHAIVRLWGKESNNFQNLKVVQLRCCEGLQSLGPPSIFPALVQLEQLEIHYCEELQEVISKETGEQEIHEEILVFPKLKCLLVMFSNLQCFYEGSYKLEFPRLERLELRSVQRMAKFGVLNNSTAFFHKEMEFPCLEELELNEVCDEVTALWDWHPSLADGGGGGITSNPVPKLRKLTIGKIERMGELPLGVTQNLSWLTVESLSDGKEVVFSASKKEESVWAYSQLPKLEELHVKKCGSLVQLFEDEDEPCTAMLKFCGQLRHLELENLGDLNRMITLRPFQNLCRLCISGLNWEYVFSADWGLEQLQSLEEIKVSECQDLEAVIKICDENQTILFPSLKKLKLESLNYVTKFSSCPDASLHFPSLETLQVSYCYSLRTLWTGAFSAPKLQEVDLWSVGLQWFITGKLNDVVAFPSLREISMSRCAAMKSFSAEPLIAPQLRKIDISHCDYMELVIYGNTNHGADLELPSLEQVTIFECFNMLSFSPAVLKASRLAAVSIDGKHYLIPEIGDLNQFLRGLYERKHPGLYKRVRNARHYNSIKLNEPSTDIEEQEGEGAPNLNVAANDIIEVEEEVRTVGMSGAKYADNIIEVEEGVPDG